MAHMPNTYSTFPAYLTETFFNLVRSFDGNADQFLAEFGDTLPLAFVAGASDGTRPSFRAVFEFIQAREGSFEDTQAAFLEQFGFSFTQFVADAFQLDFTSSTMTHEQFVETVQAMDAHCRQAFGASFHALAFCFGFGKRSRGAAA